VTAASTHLEIWDKISRPDPKALKQFQRSGGFRGTAINPMHTLHTVTQVFGPCGTGWGMTKPEFQVVGSNVYCSVGVWYKGAMSEPVWGVGGEALTGRGDDEAFKKAYTDALGNALKHLGANADIYFGAWDGNKYVDEKPEAAPKNITPHEDPPQNTGPQLLTRDEARKLYKTLQTELVKLGTVREVSQWEKSRLLEISKLGDWRSYMDKEISNHLDYIEKNTPQEAAE
jgi:hypothetical protein